MATAVLAMMITANTMDTTIRTVIDGAQCLLRKKFRDEARCNRQAESEGPQGPSDYLRIIKLKSTIEAVSKIHASDGLNRAALLEEGQFLKT